MRDVSLYALFSPQVIAVIGDLDNPGSSARVILANLEGWGYQGRIVSVNWPATADAASFDQLRGADTAVLCLPPERVLAALEQAADHGVKAVMVTTAGFREIGGQGYLLEEAIIHLAERRNLTLLGPNCLGAACWADSFNASTMSKLPGAGGLAFFSPSRSMCHAILDWAANEEIGFSKFLSLGNRPVIDEASLLQFLAGDEKTKVIVGYLEGMNNGRRFARISQTVTRTKPVIMLQVGLSEYGQIALASHVGALTGSERAYQAAMKQAGIIQVDNLAALFDLARIFSTQPLPAGPNLAIVTNSGGAGILAADGLAGTSLHLPRLGAGTIEGLSQKLSRPVQTANPVDIGADAPPELYAQALAQVLSDPQIHMALVVIAPGQAVDLPAIVQHLADLPRVAGRPVAVCLVGQESMCEKRLLQKSGVPCFSYPKAALTSLGAMFRYAQWQQTPYPVEVCYRRDKTKAEAFLQDCQASGKTELVDYQMQPLFHAYELHYPRTELARTSKSAVKIAKRLDCPVGLKIASPHIEYRSDVEGVALNLQTAEEVRRSFWNLTSRVQCFRRDAFLSGCLVQEMIHGQSVEVRIQSQRDPHFGPLIRFSLAGNRAGLFQDSSLRLAPLSLEDASAMLRELKISSLLKRPLDLRALEDVLLTVSQMTLDFPEINALEFDPVLVTSRGAWIVGARLSLLFR